MGCSGTKEARRQELQEATQGTDVMALGKALTQAWKAGVAQELRAAGEMRLLELPKGAVAFEETTPMLVMPFKQFRAQGRIFKSIKAWRDEALEKQWLVVYDESSGMVVIFVSHTWWDRDFTDETNDPKDKYDKGGPDYMADYPTYERFGITYQNCEKNLKWRVICAGVQRLCEEQGLNEEDVALWVDWQSIYQDHEEMKLKGVISLISYATKCQFMLIPTEESGDLGDYPEVIPGYGTRGWCRVEHFIFALLAEMEGEVAEYEE